MSLGNQQNNIDMKQTQTNFPIPSRYWHVWTVFLLLRSFSGESQNLLPFGQHSSVPMEPTTECAAGEHQLAGEGTGVRRTHQRQDGRGTGGPLVAHWWPIGSVARGGFCR